MRNAMYIAAVTTPLLLLMLLPTAALSASFNGTYTARQGAITVTLVFQQDASNRVVGVMRNSQGLQFNLSGKVNQRGVAAGVVVTPTGRGFFEAQVMGNQLQIAMIERGADGRPDMSRVRRAVFVRQGASATPGHPPQAAPDYPPQASAGTDRGGYCIRFG